jgi:Holliday junction resolvase RusA-like endonuclease
VKDYRKAVLAKCVGRGGVHGQFRLNVHFSPPDARARDMDNAMKSLFDALVPAGFIPADSMTYMRELWVTVDDKRLGTVAVEAIPLGREAA